MDKNEFLKSRYTFLYRHYWFFAPVFKAPGWQLYLITLLIMSVITSSWFMYWHLPISEQKLKYNQQIRLNGEQQVLLKQLEMKLQKTLIPIPTLSVTDCIVHLITLAQKHDITIISYTPTHRSVHQKAPTHLDITTITLVMHSNSYASIKEFMSAMVMQYPMIEIVDMLIRKSANLLIVNIQLQLLTHETQPNTSVHTLSVINSFS